jgi:mRNA interferase MazF
MKKRRPATWQQLPPQHRTVIPGLLICCPISTNIREQATEVAVNNLDQASVVASRIIQTLSWKDCHTTTNTAAENEVMEKILLRWTPLIGADSLLDE